MAIKIKKIIVFLLIIILVSCNNETNYNYYPSGIISEKKVFSQKGDTSTYFFTKYYPNQQIQMQGHVVNSMREGIWHEWYADGQLLWKGEYIEGWIQPPDSIGHLKCLFSDSLIAGKPVNIRVFVDGIYRTHLSVGFTNLSILCEADNLDMYDFTILPKESGLMSINVTAIKKGVTKGTVELVEMRDSFYVYPNRNNVLSE